MISLVLSSDLEALKGIHYCGLVVYIAIKHLFEQFHWRTDT